MDPLPIATHPQSRSTSLLCSQLFPLRKGDTIFECQLSQAENLIIRFPLQSTLMQ